MLVEEKNCGIFLLYVPTAPGPPGEQGRLTRLPAVTAEGRQRAGGSVLAAAGAGRPPRRPRDASGAVRAGLVAAHRGPNFNRDLGRRRGIRTRRGRCRHLYTQ
jgi:hypothetical protein